MLHTGQCNDLAATKGDETVSGNITRKIYLSAGAARNICVLASLTAIEFYIPFQDRLSVHLPIP
jgi:hypothetical protein